MVQESANKLNYFPVSPAYFPHMIINRRNITYATHGLYHTGEYVLGHQDVTIKNNIQPRVLDCIYLRPLAVIHGKHKLYHIETRKVITCRHCTSAIINTNILTKIHQAVVSNKLPTGLQFQINHTDNLLAGVDNDTETNFIDKDTDIQEIDKVMDTNKIDIIQEIPYKPNEFNTPNITNKAKIHQENKNILVNDSQSSQRDDTMQTNHQSNIENITQSDIQREAQ